MTPKGRTYDATFFGKKVKRREGITAGGRRYKAIKYVDAADKNTTVYRSHGVRDEKFNAPFGKRQKVQIKVVRNGGHTLETPIKKSATKPVRRKK